MWGDTNLSSAWHACVSHSGFASLPWEWYKFELASLGASIVCESTASLRDIDSEIPTGIIIELCQPVGDVQFCALHNYELASHGPSVVCNSTASVRGELCQLNTHIGELGDDRPAFTPHCSGWVSYQLSDVYYGVKVANVGRIPCDYTVHELTLACVGQHRCGITLLEGAVANIGSILRDYSTHELTLACVG